MRRSSACGRCCATSTATRPGTRRSACPRSSAASLPMRNYVATVQLKRVTDGDRTFWHWESTFDVPRRREREFEQLVGGQVYEAGFTGLAAFLGRGGRSSPPPQAG